MSFAVIVTPEAEEDIEEIRDQLAQRHSGLEVIFLTRLRDLRRWGGGANRRNQTC